MDVDAAICLGSCLWESQFLVFRNTMRPERWTRRSFLTPARLLWYFRHSIAMQGSLSDTAMSSVTHTHAPPLRSLQSQRNHQQSIRYSRSIPSPSHDLHSPCLSVCLPAHHTHGTSPACREQGSRHSTRVPSSIPPRSAHDSWAYSPTCIPATRPAVVRAGVTKIASGRKRELDGGEVHDTAGRGLVALGFRSELHACRQACKRQVSLCLCGTGPARLVFLSTLR